MPPSNKLLRIYKHNAAIGIAKKPDKSENYIMMGLMSVIKMGSGAVHGK